MKYLNWLWFLLMDERGENDPSGAGAGSQPPAAVGEGNEPPVGEGQPGEGAGEGKEPPITEPKYGEFGDNPTPDQIFEAYGKTQKKFNDFRIKAGLTEKNLAQTRQFLKSVGLVEQDGKWVMPYKENSQERKTRFTEDHKKLFHPQVLSAIDAYVKDMIEEAFSGYGRQQLEQQKWQSTLNKSIDRMYKLYPMLQSEINGNPNPNFNKELNDRATEILNDPTSGYTNLANGDLLAAHEAALELGVSPITIEKAKIEGANNAKGNKRIIGAAGGGGKPGIMGKLTREKYMALNPEDKKIYDAKQVLDKK